MAINGSAFRGAPIELVPHKQSFGEKVIGGLKTTADTISSMKTLYDVGKGIWDVARMIPRVPV